MDREEVIQNIQEIFLYGGVGQLRRSKYGPRVGRGSRVRAMFPPRILPSAIRDKMRLSPAVRLKALQALRKQTSYMTKPLARPATPTVGDRMFGVHEYIEENMEKKSRLQRRLETKAVGRPAKTRQVARDKRARRGYKFRMAMSKGKAMLSGAVKGAVVGGVAGAFVDQYRAKPTRAGVSANAPKVGRPWKGVPKRQRDSVIGKAMAVGAGAGAFHGSRKAASGWHHARRHGQAIDKSYEKLSNRRYKRQRKQSMREEVVEAILEVIAGEPSAKSIVWNALKTGVAASRTEKKMRRAKHGRIGGALKNAKQWAALATKKGRAKHTERIYSPQFQAYASGTETRIMKGARKVGKLPEAIVAEVFDDRYKPNIAGVERAAKGTRAARRAQLWRKLKTPKAMGKKIPLHKDFKKATNVAKAAGVSKAALHFGARKLGKKYHRAIKRA